MAASVVRRWVVHACKVLAALGGVLVLVAIVRSLAASAIGLTDSDTAPLLVIAGLWLLFFVGLGTAHWRARRAMQNEAAGHRGRPHGRY